MQAAAAAAGATLPLERAWFGLSGFDRAEDRARMEPSLRALARSLAMTNDARLVLAGLSGGIGIALIAGTGSIAYGTDPTGASARAGGWGNLIGDEGSGWRMGRDALAAVAQATDGRAPATELTERILSHWRLDNPSDLILRVYDPAMSKGDIAELSGIVFAAASAGDAVARGIVDDAVRSLATIPVAVAGRLSFPGAIPLAFAGGLLLYRSIFRQRVLDLIGARVPVAPPVLIDDPALAAARAAATDGGPFQ
jgi:N-acetylglucosamine kinase-like BadF-type ATPase